jgi:hypothetical protein
MSQIKGKPGIGTKIRQTIGDEISLIIGLLEKQVKINLLLFCGFILNLLISIAIIIYLTL